MIPSWIKIKKFDREKYLKTIELIEKRKLNTVCTSANCPNRYECFSNKTATFMILGDTCTRNCSYCSIKKGKPSIVDKDEPRRIAEAAAELKLDYLVVTCVTRDDLFDGGAEQFVKVIENIREKNPECRIELLISDLNSNIKALKKIISAKPDVINHNIETSKKLFPKLRPKGNYNQSLELLKKIKEINPKIIVKSGFMIGLGENKEEIISTIKDLKENGCDIITIGQYLQPNEKCVKVHKFYNEKEFDEINKIGGDFGIKIIAGALVRSSYKAKELFEK